MTRRSWQKTALRWLIVSFLLILSPVYVLDVILYKTGLDTLRGQTTKAMEAQVAYFMDGLSGEVARIRTLQLELVNDRDINRLAAIPESLDIIETVFGLLRIQGRLFAIKNSSSYIQDVTVMIPAAGRQISHSGISDLDEAAFSSLRSLAVDLDRHVSYLDGRMLLLTQYPYPYLSASRAVQFLIVIELSIGQFERVLEGMANERGSGAILADRGRQRAIAVGAALDADPERQWAILNMVFPGKDSVKGVSIGGRRFLSVARTSVYLDAVFCKLIPEDTVFSSLRPYQGWFYVSIAMGFAIIVIYSVITYRFIHKPLNRLAAAFKHIEKGQFDLPIEHDHDDEFRYIYGQFNTMAANLKTLIDQVYNQRILVQRAEMRQLQSQINPHFLYNAFFMLHGMTRTGDLESLEKVTQQLGLYFRYITRNAADVVTLAEEVRHARIYADIQARRFSNRVTLRFEEVPEGFALLQVPRLILQPILENAFEHGLSSSAAGGELSVGFHAGADVLDIDVENGGAALDDSRIASIRDSIDSGAVDGEMSALANIHRRLRLEFGPTAGLTVHQGSAGGLRLTIRLAIRFGAARVQPCTAC